ncbi:photosystem I reaction center subunit VI, chloroplastic-like [Miscanthus floridulus]|uniref:photosystem I reaction center subunit VI, chloroplastic-like n=1 Tax=Miscanthus floridulus TaxID=154761 RepID=UPI00345AADA6
MGGRGPSNPLDPENGPKPIHRVHTFFLAYGAKAVLPSDLDHGAPRVKAFDHDRAMEAQQDAVNLLKEARKKGLSGSSISGRKLAIARPSTHAACRSTRRAAVVAKYGDKSIYFDLEDIGNTTGQWDLYGSDAPSPYNPLQSKFFETFAAPFTKRGLLLGGGSLLAYVSASASPDLLPIKKGPQQPPQPGPRGKI